MGVTATGTNPIVVTGTTGTSDDITDDNIQIIGLYWLQPTAQGNKLALQDKNGVEKWAFYCDDANSSQHAILPEGGLYSQGLYSDDMDSGTLYVFVK